MKEWSAPKSVSARCKGREYSRLRIWGTRFRDGGRFALLRPLGEDALAQFANRLDRSGFGLMGRAALCHEILHHSADLQKSLSPLGPIGKTLVQTSRSFQ